MQTFDRTTGQPLPPPPLPSWKDDAWVDPKIILTNASFPDLPLSEIARLLRQEFKEQFDILMPAPPADNGMVINQFNGLPQRDKDWNQLTINLRLKDVTASEIFNAMNLMFQNDQTPLRWELKVNGDRQLAVLHVLVQRSPVQEVQEVRKVYFVGDLIGDQKNGGMSMEQVIQTISDVWGLAGDAGGKIQFHNDAQLLVVSGTPNQIDFMEQTLAALRQKVDQARDKEGRAKLGFGEKAGGSQNESR
ncbi:MAG TPA: hypothetical protein VN873_04915 [Candidatus Angelobacter sp.]|nr:hypothetical protein [Candidatus Angelobacter sp.]